MDRSRPHAQVGFLHRAVLTRTPFRLVAKNALSSPPLMLRSRAAQANSLTRALSHTLRTPVRRWRHHLARGLLGMRTSMRLSRGIDVRLMRNVVNRKVH